MGQDGKDGDTPLGGVEETLGPRDRQSKCRELSGEGGPGGGGTRGLNVYGGQMWGDREVDGRELFVGGHSGSLLAAP